MAWPSTWSTATGSRWPGGYKVLKRSDVAAHVGVTEQEVSRWEEEGGCDLPVGHATALAELFGLSVPWLTGAVGLPAGWRG